METQNHQQTVILLIIAALQKRLSSYITGFIYDQNGIIVRHDQYVDSKNGIFFNRIEWIPNNPDIDENKIKRAFAQIVEEKGVSLNWSLFLSNRKQKMAIYVSKKSSCLYDILSRQHRGQFNVEIPLIISNHRDLEAIAQQYGIAFYYFPISSDNKHKMEKQQIILLKKNKIDFIVLARYMQILSVDFIKPYPEKIINIHHAFLPAFCGSNPYQAAHDRGVKLIGATAHFVTNNLDEGPIIEQDVVRVSHKDSVEDLIRKGNDIEMLVLSRAIWNYLQRNILVYNNKTVVFS